MRSNLIGRTNTEAYPQGVNDWFPGSVKTDHLDRQMQVQNKSVSSLLILQ